ncbi:MAG: TMEM43 family protein [Ahniella sp.]|nr:TMEM43 family protein [Ahniella sp.]
MSDQFTVVTKQGFGSRFGNSIKGMIFGFVFFVGSFPLLWINEGRAVSVAKSLAEGAKSVVSVVAESLDVDNEGKLVHLNGLVEADTDPVDPISGVTVQALGLKREVEMYQWIENEKRESVQKTGGGTEQRITYSYRTDWDDERIDSDSFHRTEGHENPGDWPLRSESFRSDNATVGAFTLGAGARQELSGWSSLNVGLAIEFPDSFGEFQRVSDTEYYLGENPKDPQVGDMRVRFNFQPEATYSVVARQSGDVLDTYETSNGRTILLVERGEKTAAEMFKAAQDRNSTLTWILRGVGAFVMWIGLITIFAPLSRLFDILPFLGNLASKGIALISAVMSVFLSLMTIGFAWIFYRPLLGGTLVVLAVALVWWMRRGKKPAMASTNMGPPSAPSGPPMAPPPPPPAA